MADEQKEKVPEADSDGDKHEAETERTAEELGEELLKRLDEHDARHEALVERITILESGASGYARSEHEHPYAGAEHEHPKPEPGVQSVGNETSERSEKAPRAGHWWYRPIRG